ncbi:hypothetical protein [Planococcus salinarum]|uniref:hypothetical protein n=1 Tax=Planococcus salinarum TaxID=622695 RepID=UPI000E3B56EA|nr:hypothetical protein [Planococcus salinarum]TAA69771.1 hypothetical protein D2909_12050 [Planococcus salinarum]
MKRSAFIAGTVLSMILLAGCTGTPEERLAEGLSETRTVFEEEPPETNETAGETELYLPGGYDIEEPTDENNVIITQGSDSFVLFINPNEAPDSKFFYDLQKANEEQEWAADETFEQNGRFGFSTLRAIADDRFEVVVSAGGVKMTTISEQSDVPENMEWMMKTVRSIEEGN